MKWYNYIFCFLAGMFIANFVPHFINGISGTAFPSPFANPPGKGLSSPITNVLWGLFNLLIGYLFFRAGKISNNNKLTIIIFAVGVLLLSIMNSIGFAGIHH